MFKRLLKNRKGTAEVVGSVMFIIILLFFFTNVYLWHDAATKQMNQVYIDKINTPITVSVQDSTHLIVTNRGGEDTSLSMLWVVVESSSGSGPDQSHVNYSLGGIVRAGESEPVLIPISIPSGHVIFKVITINGNTASCNYQS
jgi:hypothetical protein